MYLRNTSVPTFSTLSSKRKNGNITQTLENKKKIANGKQLSLKNVQIYVAKKPNPKPLRNMYRERNGNNRLIVSIKITRGRKETANRPTIDTGERKALHIK